MTRDDPRLDPSDLAACLAADHGVRATEIAFLPVGFDMNAAVYRVSAADGAALFLKVRSTRVPEPELRVARALADAGIHSVVASIPNRAGALWTPLGERHAVLYPFVAGENAMVAGMTGGQWVAFGAALRAIHDSGLHVTFGGELPVEAFDLPSAALVREMSAHLGTTAPKGPAADLAALWRAHRGRIDTVLARAEELGRTLRTRMFELVLCHADIHAANVMDGAGDGGAVHLVDWDDPKVAPRERDLLFVVGSTIARTVEPDEEAAFFAGYGPVAIDTEAIVYYRYERFLEDLGVIGRDVFLNPALSEELRRQSAVIAGGYFSPAATSTALRWSPPTARTYTSHPVAAACRGALLGLPRFDVHDGSSAPTAQRAHVALDGGKDRRPSRRRNAGALEGLPYANGQVRSSAVVVPSGRFRIGPTARSSSP